MSLKFLISVITISILSITNGFGQTELKIPQDSLPKLVKEQLHHKFHDYSIAASIKKTDENGLVTYLLDAKREKNSSETIVYHLVYNSSGKLMKKKKEKEIYYTGREKSTPKSSGGPPTPGGGHQH
tara:strand:- start:56 stop:433 length:378 start_codon:yes stop_codon:yes gene_type:complete